jgi:phospholipid N-methyltransferase
MDKATYSPEDNKLRFYPANRLSAEDYNRFRKAGFKWAPAQKLFVAPMWTPGRENLLLQFCGDIGDEDTTLAERAEERAGRFEGYSEKRLSEAQQTKKHVKSITKHIPFGQPILIGHHSERKARKDAEKIENGLRKAVSLWETSQYWEDRAAGAIEHAKYKELPGVRARRIKKIEAEKRKDERSKKHALKCIDLWGTPPLTKTWALKIANTVDNHGHYCFSLADYPRPETASQYEGSQCLWSALSGEIITPEQAKALSIPHKHRVIALCDRWINHYNNRLTYEKAMLAAQGASELIAKKPRPKQLPLCNYRASEGIQVENMYNRGSFSLYPQREMTKADYSQIYSEHRGTRPIEGSHRIKTALIKSSFYCIFLTDSKVHEKPVAAAKESPAEELPEKLQAITDSPQPQEDSEGDEFEAMKDTLKAGVKISVAPQLFPTPPSIAENMVELADIDSNMTILEPSAGTGNLIAAIEETGIKTEITAVEINHSLSEQLRQKHESCVVENSDFLECNGNLGKFDRIIMNPPYKNGEDIKHILHAKEFLREGGKLVALCANGPRQQKLLQAIADYWVALPQGSFAESGTNVNVAMLVIT